MATVFESSRAPNTSLQPDTDHSSSWLGSIFKPFEAPLDFEDDGIQVSDHYHWRYLGVSCLKSEKYGTLEVPFFQVFESITKQVPTPGISSKQSTLTLATTSLPNHDQHPACIEPFPNHSIVVISLNTQIFKPSKRQQYYIFPCDSIVETVNKSPPYELFCSFYTISFIHGLESSNNNNTSSSHAKDSSSNDQGSQIDLSLLPSLLAHTPEIKTEQQRNNNKQDLLPDPSIAHVSLSGVSKELYIILKETVAVFETTYRSMMQLLEFHTQGISNRHSEYLVVGGTNETRTSKSSSEVKPSKSKRKGSSQQRQSSPRSSSANVMSTTASLSSNRKSTPLSSDDFDQIAMVPVSPSSSSRKVTRSNSPPPTTPLSPMNNSPQRHNPVSGRKCIYCGATKTPMWRRGPGGAGTLCNACGVKWKHGKILCGKSSEVATVHGSASTPAPGSTKVQQKKRKQQGQVKIQKDKRVKIKEHQRLQQEHGDFLDVNGSAKSEELDNFDGYTDDEDDVDVDGDNDDMEVDDPILATRRFSTDQVQQQYHSSMSSYHLSPLPPHSRSRSMTSPMAPNYLPYQQQQEWSLSPGLEQQTSPHFHLDEQQQQQQQRPRRHTADVSILDRSSWGEYPLSMGVDAVEAATVLTLLKRS
ncbi:unnamed protein product [Absidia cylindrospora]